MPRYFTHYWQNDTVEKYRASGRYIIEWAGSNVFLERGIDPGDVVYPVTVSDGTLYLLGRLEVERVCDVAEAEERLGYVPSWEASDYVIAADPPPAHFDLAVPLEVTRRLRFVSGQKPVPPRFASPGRLDQQTMRGVRELTPESADLLDRVLSSEVALAGSHVQSTGWSGPRLKPYEDYTRKEVRDIFAPDSPFTPQRGTWGLQGIVAIPDRPGDYVFFVTLGQQQGEHVFDEGITEDGVLSWQSQPRQSLDSPQIREFIEHDELNNSIYLFFRTNRRAKYTFLGRLKYLSHDIEREHPVYFQWQILNWNPSESMLGRMGLVQQPSTREGEEKEFTGKHGLIETEPPPARPSRATTPSFRAHKTPDYSEKDARNRELGMSGELLIVKHEKEMLEEGARPDLASRVRHTSIVEGDGAGYDILSFTLQGKRKYIEVKTTRGPAETPFYATSNEVAFSALHANDYRLYRVYDYDQDRNFGKFYVVGGSLAETFELSPTQFKASRKADEGTVE